MAHFCLILILLAGLLSSCQSSRPAFQFSASAPQPVPSATEPRPAVTAAPVSASPAPPAPARQWPPVRPGRLLRAVAGPAGRALASPHNYARRTVRGGRPAVARQQPAAAPRVRKGDIQDVLGGLAFIGGIVLWVVVGGWAGFGLFALGLLLSLLVLYWSFGSGGMP